MIIGASKTKVMIMARESDDEELQIDGNQLEMVDNFRYSEYLLKNYVIWKRIYHAGFRVTQTM